MIILPLRGRGILPNMSKDPDSRQLCPADTLGSTGNLEPDHESAAHTLPSQLQSLLLNFGDTSFAH